MTSSIKRYKTMKSQGKGSILRIFFFLILSAGLLLAEKPQPVVKKNEVIEKFLEALKKKDISMINQCVDPTIEVRPYPPWEISKSIDAMLRGETSYKSYLKILTGVNIQRFLSHVNGKNLDLLATRRLALKAPAPSSSTRRHRSVSKESQSVYVELSVKEKNRQKKKRGKKKFFYAEIIIGKIDKKDQVIGFIL